MTTRTGGSDETSGYVPFVSWNFDVCDIERLERPADEQLVLAFCRLETKSQQAKILFSFGKLVGARGT
jgi:hypothetical protein